MSETFVPSAVGKPLERLDGRLKVTGTAPYAFEHEHDDPLYLEPLLSSIARGRVHGIDAGVAAALDGVVAILTHLNATRLADASDGELAILQSDEVGFRGQIIGGVIAETPEIAKHAAGLVEVTYDEQEHDADFRADAPGLYAPEKINGGFETDTAQGDVDAALASAAFTLDQTYTTPMQHNNPMEPHTCVAQWVDGAAVDRAGVAGAAVTSPAPLLTLWDSTQGVHPVRKTLAPVFGLQLDQMRVISPHVGGGFGSKGLPHAHNVLAVMAAQMTGGRPVKLALSRQQLFSLAGYRSPTIQRLRLGAGDDGRLTAVANDSIVLSSRTKEFAEQSAVPARMMYSGAHRHTSHLVAPMDVPVPSWMRAPGEAPGMIALEIAMDEFAEVCGLDPIEMRFRNEPETDPESGTPWSGRHLIECLRTGAERFGWDQRRGPGARRDGDWLTGLGVASATYPASTAPGTETVIRYEGAGTYAVEVGAADLGTGTWTALTQIAADALGVPFESVHLEIGDTDLPPASVAGGSSGISSWGSSIVATARAFRHEHGDTPHEGDHARASTPRNEHRGKFSMHSFGAQFAEVRVRIDTGEIEVPRMLGVFSVGRIINPRTALSQFIGGMTMGLSAALHEHSVLDPHTGHVVNHDLAGYHIPTHADVRDIDAIWLDEVDEHVNPMGSKGIGEIGIVGAPAAIANAVYNATGIRVRDLPITPDLLLR